MPDYKGLRGDPSDNIIGIAGIGEKTATTLITTFGSIENMYAALEAARKEIKKDKKKEKTKEAQKEPYAAFKKVGVTDRVIKLLEDGKEEAEFSKMLATIRRDAPIDFVLPEKSFRDGLDTAKVQALFTELDFRTLGARLTQVLAGKPSAAAAKAAGVKSVKEIKAEKTQKDADEMSKIDPEEFRKTGIALWLVNSNLSEPTLEDIYNFAKVNVGEEGAFAKARAIIFVELDKRNLRKVYETIELP